MELPLSKGLYLAKFDPDFFDQFKSWSFSASSFEKGCPKKYVVIKPKNGSLIPDGIERRRYKAHRVVIGATSGEIVDHINGDTMDNRRCNLRIVTPSANAKNRTVKAADATSKYFGVSLNERGEWVAQVTLPNMPKHVYRGKSEHEAAAARDLAIIESGCEYSTTNTHREYINYIALWAEKHSPKVLALVSAFESLLCEISEPSWTDDRIRYEQRQITKGEVERAREALAAFRGGEK